MAALLNECALALEKERIAREKSDAELQAQQEQLRANLLRTISHDPVSYTHLSSGAL